MKIEVYADIVCPWCYIGMRRLGAALATRPDLVAERVWRPFQLRPEMPRGGEPWESFAIEKFGGRAQMDAAFAQVARAGEPDGITFHFDRIASAANTVDAHRLVSYAVAFGREWETAEALFAAYFTDGGDLNDTDTLVAAAISAGLDGDDTRLFLGTTDGESTVMESQQDAYRDGVQGVPFYIFDERYALSGAQPVAVFLQVFDHITNELAVAAHPTR